MGRLLSVSVGSGVVGLPPTDDECMVSALRALSSAGLDEATLMAEARKLEPEELHDLLVFLDEDDHLRAARAEQARMEAYRADYRLYCRERLKVELTPDQCRIFESVLSNRYTLVKASHAAGKSFGAACLLNYWHDCWDAHIGYVTAPTWNQAMGLTFKTAAKMRRENRLPGKIIDGTGLVKDDDPVRAVGHYFKALNAESGEGFQGEHTSDLLIIIEEGVGVPSYIWEAMRGLMTSPGCFAAGTLVSAGGVENATARRYVGDAVEIVTAGGHEATVTPNHPVLTPEGWVAAGALHVGDRILCCRDAQAATAALFGPDHEQVHARIEDVAATLLDAGGVRMAVAGSDEQFHGDGFRAQVDVVWAKGFLRDRVHAALAQPLSEQLLMDGPVAPARLAGRGHLASLLAGVLPSARRVVRGFEHGARLLGRALARHEPVGCALAAQGDARLLQETGHGNAGDAQLARHGGDRCPIQIGGDNGVGVVGHPEARDADGLFTPSRFHADAPDGSQDGGGVNPVLVAELRRAFPGNVATDEVVEVRRVPFSGHVHNLQTVSGWYTANGIVAHNCRCLAIGNPTNEASPFGEAASQQMWEVFAISALDHPNIIAELRGEPQPYAGAVGLLWLSEMLGTECDPSETDEEDAFRYWRLPLIRQVLAGEASIPDAADFASMPEDDPRLCWYRPTAEFQGRVLGEFPSVPDEQVIPSGWLRNLPVRPDPVGVVPEIGCDVARFGTDRTVIVTDWDGICTSIEVIRRMDTLTVARKCRFAAVVAGLMAGCAPKTVPIKVDTTGSVGPAVYDLLREWGYCAVECNSSHRAYEAGKYPNRRSELWFIARDGFRLKRVDLSRLPPDKRRLLEKELTVPRWKLDPAGRKVVEKKEDIKKRLLYSPDVADAYNMARTPAIVLGGRLHPVSADLLGPETPIEQVDAKRGELEREARKGLPPDIRDHVLSLLGGG